MKLSNLKNSGHWPTLLAAFLYFDFSFMVWTVLGPLGAQIGESLNLSAEQKGLMVALPILAGAFLRILLGLFVDRVGAKKDPDAHWFCFYYTISFGGFVGLASSYILYFKGEFGLAPVHGGDFAALGTFVGAFLRPVGGATSDHIGGIRSLYRFYLVSGFALIAAALIHHLIVNLALFVVASGSLGMANGAVFQLLPQRFCRDVGIMTGLVGAGRGIGGFYLASSLGLSKGLTGSYQYGFLVFAGLCFLAIVGLSLVKTRWRSTWGALAGARI